MANPEGAISGQLFPAGFIGEELQETDDWNAVSDVDLKAFEAAVADLFKKFPTDKSPPDGPNESQTEKDLIWKVLELLGWEHSLTQQNLSEHKRSDVPDGLLFADEQAKDRANQCKKDVERYELGLALMEAKRWALPLDRRTESVAQETAPSTQMLRYLRRVDDLTSGNLRWGILTNGAKWRLYWSGARSVSEQFFELDLAAVMDIPGHNEGLFKADAEDRPHWMKVFFMFFRRDAFIPGPDTNTFHRRVIDEGRLYEERVAGDLSGPVFNDVFPGLVRAVAAEAPKASMQDVREAALIFLYRLLFIFYAEDRNLLPADGDVYGQYSMRRRVREDVHSRGKTGKGFAPEASQYWSAVDEVRRYVDKGADSMGLPPYNGGLFDPATALLLAQIEIGDDVMAEIIQALSYTPDGRYINYRDLSVQQLGSIYERLLEHEVVREGGKVDVKLNIYARKRSGSYYTPDDLVGLILREAVGPLVDARMEAFESEAGILVKKDKKPAKREIAQLQKIDPAEALLDLKICDPAMGSGHFLVSLVDMLSDRVLDAMAEAAAEVEGYVSPLLARIDDIRARIMQNAQENGWTVNIAQLDDRHIVRRMVLKRCVYGVDKNPMAVELAKVALWLHTFTVGAPLGFLDHHLRSGDSLFGCWVRDGMDAVAKRGMLLNTPITEAARASVEMRQIENFTDIEVVEAHRSADIFEEVKEMTAPLNAFLSLTRAFDWLNIRDKKDTAALHAFYYGAMGDPIKIATGEESVQGAKGDAKHFKPILEQARALAAEEQFFNWQVMFPGIWDTWESNVLHGGFDAVIGNPPWDRMKLQQIEWFAERRPEIARAPKAADRKRMVKDLEKKKDPLAKGYAKASGRAEAAARMARTCGDYPLLSGGDVNLYSLFVERAMALCKPEGMVGLLTPSGIASDKTAAKFFQGVTTEGRLKALYDFENRRTRFNKKPFFPDVDSRFKFCVFAASRAPLKEPAQCAFFLQDVVEIENPDICFSMTAEDFTRVNPNTGTAPIFRSRRDAELTTGIYGRLPILVDRSGGKEIKTWPVEYTAMFHMTNDSGLFRTRKELEGKERAYPVGGNRYESEKGAWAPLYVGRMIYHFDHRAASVDVNEGNLNVATLTDSISSEQKSDPDFSPTPQYWVSREEINLPDELGWVLAFRDITNPTNARTAISAAVPKSGIGNTAPLLLPLDSSAYGKTGPLLLGNINSVILDYVARQKVQGTHLSWFILEQLPVIPPDQYNSEKFGPKKAGDIVREAVLELTYTAHDMAPFAKDMGYVDKKGKVKPPFVWNAERRLNLRAKLDALYFHLYGVTDPDDVKYIYSTFPIVEREETKAHGRYASRDLCLNWINALHAGKPDAEISL